MFETKPLSLVSILLFCNHLVCVQKVDIISLKADMLASLSFGVHISFRGAAPALLLSFVKRIHTICGFHHFLIL